MKTNIFSVYDEKAKLYGVPWVKIQVGEAIREFGDLAESKDSKVSRHPEDYHLYHIGEFDDESARLVSFPEPRMVARATEFVEIGGVS